MLLGALVDAGVDPEILHKAASALTLGAPLQIERVDRSGITATKVHVFEGAKLAESDHHSHASEPAHQHTHTHQHHPQTQHEHKVGHSHTHDHDHPQDHEHEHQHGRSLTVIRTLINSANLATEVKQTAIQAFELLGASEAK